MEVLRLKNLGYGKTYLLKYHLVPKNMRFSSKKFIQVDQEEINRYIIVK